MSDSEGQQTERSGEMAGSDGPRDATIKDDRTPAAGDDNGARPKKNAPSLHDYMSKGRERKKRNELADDSDDDIVEQLKDMVISENKPKPLSGTALAYNDVMSQYYCEWDPNYTESPQRITESFKRVCDLQLDGRCVRIQSRYATEDHVRLQHSEQHVTKARESALMSTEQLMHLSEKYDSLFFHNKIYECALLALGSAIEVMEQVIQQKVRNGFAIVRPPGHHAMHDEFCGYCIFNNVAIAAKYAVEEYGLERILIVDWDVHHGQGTQFLFYDDPRVLYFSIHRYEHGKFWPSLRESEYDYIGEGAGKGFNINVPVNQVGVSDSEYMAIMQQILLPVAYEFCPQLILISSGYDSAIGCPEFSPQLILISCGYDAAIGDLKGELRVSPAAYAHFVHMLSSLADGRLCAVLEGGYCMKSLAEGVALTIRELLGDPCPLLKPTQEPCDSITESILNVIKVLHPYWKCLQYQDSLQPGETCCYSGVQESPPKPDIVFETPETRPEKFDIMNSCPILPKDEAEALDREIDQLIAETNLSKAPNCVCLVFDAEMRAHKHCLNNHPERPDRISRIYEQHGEWGLLGRCLQLKSRLATEEELALIHSPRYVEELCDISAKTPRELTSIEAGFESVYLSQKMYHTACLAAGSVLNVVDSVLKAESQSGVAIVRPPGHHAEEEKPRGFCFFNSVAIAAKYAQKKYGIKRILVVDWDVHHGNGTQHALYNDPSILFMSLHRYDDGSFYPGSSDANYDQVGEGDGRGFNINIPWNRELMGDAEYLAAFQQIVMPVAYEFAPELVLVSAGFDAARGDPLGDYDVTPQGYCHMTHMLQGLANGRVILVLEGGYNLTSISQSMAACTAVLLGDPCPQLKYAVPCQSAVNSICQVLDQQKLFWKCLKFRVKIPKAAEPDADANESQLATDTVPVDALLDGFQSLTVEGSPCESSITEQASKTEAEEELQGAYGGSESMTVMEALGLPDCDQMFAVHPLPWCPHLTTVNVLPSSGLDALAPCKDCGNTNENWVCLVCYKVFCSRYVNEHMVFHGVSEQHLVVLSYADLSIWCYGCESYVDNAIIYPAKQSAYRSKFGKDLPGT